MASTITVYADVILSNRVIQAGITGRNRRLNARVTTSGGHQTAEVMWNHTLREFDFESVPLRRADWQYLEQLHEITDGGAFGFLMLDPKDHAVTVTDGVVEDVGGGVYQLKKRYTEPLSGRTKDRKITRPVPGGVTVYVSGSPAAIVLDNTDGTLTIAGSPDASLVTWAGRFYVPVHFKDDFIEWALIAPSQDPDARFIAGTSIVLEEVRE